MPTSLLDVLRSSSLSARLTWPNSDGVFSGDANLYWSKQARRLVPSVIVQPSSAEEVADAIKIIANFNDGENIHPFAIRSGGHTTWAGAANVHGGVTIDLRGLNKVVIHEDRRRVTIQPGTTWQEAFKELDKAGLAISGGRVGSVGVGGLSLGGGLSYFSPRYGFVCDNVISFEVVTAQGEILEASRDSHPDLYKVLKGGSNNFGVVTSFTVEAFDQGKIWYGNWYYTLDTAEKQFEALYEVATSSDYDKYASVMLSYGFKAGQGSAFVGTLVYTQEVEAPPALRPFTKIPHMFTTQRITTMGEALTEQGSMSNGDYYQLMRTITIVPHKDLFKSTFDLWEEARATVEEVAGIVYSITNHVVPQMVFQASARNGGNSLGLDDTETPLVIVLVTATWEKADDAQIVTSATKKLLDSLHEKAQELGHSHDFIYLNYAEEDQNVLDSYGEKVKANMKKVSKKYDPQGLFQKACGGGFKLQ